VIQGVCGGFLKTLDRHTAYVYYSHTTYRPLIIFPDAWQSQKRKGVMIEESSQISSSGIPDFKIYCREIPDFPKKGIIFRDITTLLKNGTVFKQAIDRIASEYEPKIIDEIVCIDARGFLIGAALAYKMGCGVIPVRKSGKLPWKVNRKTYDLEYGKDTLEIHQDAFEPGQKVLIVDDVLATGGTAAAVVSLVREMHAEVVGATFLMELKDLKGKEKLKDICVFSLIEC
jgi:adenine phosphoribosyltransferase